MATFTGDILIKQRADGSFDINFVNGQPEMTNSFDTMVLLAMGVNGEFWQNGITDKEEEKYNGLFLKVIDRATVSDKTKNDGIQALKKDLEFMINLKMAQTINITGQIINVNAIGWGIEITKPNDESVKYFINWEKGIISVNGGQ